MRLPRYINSSRVAIRKKYAVFKINRIRARWKHLLAVELSRRQLYGLHFNQKFVSWTMAFTDFYIRGFLKFYWGEKSRESSYDDKCCSTLQISKSANISQDFLISRDLGNKKIELTHTLLPLQFLLT